MTHTVEGDRSQARWGELVYQLPTPIAALIDASMRPDPREHLWGQLNLAVGAVRFLAYLYAADAVARGATLSLHVVRQPGLGGWLSLFASAVEASRALEIPSVLPSVGVQVRGGRVEELTALVERRNDIAHLRVDPFQRGSISSIADELRPALATLVALVEPLSGLPFGWFDLLANGPEGFTVCWYPMRGPALRHRQAVRLHCTVAPPTERIVVLDRALRRALVVDPLILRHDPSIVLLDGAHDGQRVRYASPVPGEAVGARAPEAIPSPAHDGDVALADYLRSPHKWHKLLPVALDDESCVALRAGQTPTLHRIEPPHAVSAAPVALAPATPPVTVWTAPPPSPYAHGAASVSTPPVTPPAPPTRFDARWIIGGALSLALASALALALIISPGGDERSTAPARSAPNAGEEVRRFLTAWVDAVSRGAGSLDALYLPAVSFHGMARAQSIEFIRSRWQERRSAGRFEVRAQTSRWYRDAESSPNTPSACRGVPGAAPEVYVLRLDATELGAPLGVAESARSQCGRVDGPYLLRARSVGGRLRICHETWHRDEALCRSCPSAWVCRDRSNLHQGGAR